MSSSSTSCCHASAVSMSSSRFKEGVGSSVILLTARDEVNDRVKGLDLGADDYLVKPFAMEELLARVRALVRRSYQRRNPVIQVGHVQINTASHEVRVAGHVVEFTAKEYALLEYLANRAGEVVTRLDIWQHIYDERSEATSNVVDVYIGYLRRKLSPPEAFDIEIKTMRGRGFVLANLGGN